MWCKVALRFLSWENATFYSQCNDSGRDLVLPPGVITSPIKSWVPVEVIFCWQYSATLDPSEWRVRCRCKLLCRSFFTVSLWGMKSVVWGCVMCEGKRCGAMVVVYEGRECVWGVQVMDVWGVIVRGAGGHVMDVWGVIVRWKVWCWGSDARTVMWVPAPV